MEVGAAGRGVAVELDRTRVGGLHEVLHEGLPALAPGADLFPADELDGDVGHPQRAVRGEQRRHAVVVAHHRRVGELAAQRLDLNAVSDGLKVTHRFLLVTPNPVCGVVVSVVRRHNPPGCQAASQQASRAWALV